MSAAKAFEHQFRRGIYRPNAQRLSISLGPLVAQRSLLFRVKADLATKTHYEQLTPTTDESQRLSTGLFAFTASARILSAALSAMSVYSPASVYSQDSWKGNSPFVPVVSVDTRRHAIAFSPSVQWSDVSLDDEVRRMVVEEPVNSKSAFPEMPPVSSEEATLNSEPDLGFVNVQTIPAITTNSEPGPTEQRDTVNSSMEAQESNGTKLKKKKKLIDDAPKRISKHSKAFGKVISHLSLQPSKKEVAEKRRTDLTIIHPFAGYRLPELKAADPIRMSFIAKSPPAALALPAAFTMTPIVEGTKEVKDTHSIAKVRLLRSTMPAAPSRPQRPQTPLCLPSTPATPAPTPAKKGHRRFKSSPAVMNFSFHAWNAEDMPPLPPMPAASSNAPPLPVRNPARARSQSVAARYRSITPPLQLLSQPDGSF